ncbi:MAG: LysM peptidoglycan-binding domain-containing protein [Clostridia bacterium]|nr:LysM peptidoglycan-binding domain-containing protein [Clostridia bacterium]
MTIHVVQSGETVASLAQRYGISIATLLQDNGLSADDSLVVGQALLVIPPTATYTVMPGDTLLSIAEQTGVAVDSLLYQNPQISNPQQLFVGQVLTLRGGEPKLGTLTVNAYVYPFVNREVLRDTLPYLTYLTIFGYGITPEGELVPTEDDELLSIAKENFVSPLMLLTALDEDGGFSSANAAAMLSNPEARARLVDEVDRVTLEKGYGGVDVDFEFIPPENAADYTALVEELSARLSPTGRVVFVALAPKTSDNQKGLLYEAHDYRALGAAADGALLMTYEWGYAYSEPMAIAPINKVQQVVQYGLSRIPAYKIFMGIPNYGYDWALPRGEGERARTISNNEALQLARRFGAEIEYDTTAQSPFFRYTDTSGRAHEVWFEDARSYDAKLRLVGGESLYGVGVWNAMSFFKPLWTLINTLFTIRKVL